MAVEFGAKTMEEIEANYEYEFSEREKELLSELLEISSAVIVVMPPRIAPHIEEAAKKANQRPEIWAASVLGMASGLGARGIDIFKLVDGIANLYVSTQEQVANIQKQGGVQ